MIPLDILSTLGFGTFVGSVLGYEYKKYRDRARGRENEREQWFDDSLDIIGRGAHNIDRALFRSDPGYERILEELGQFSERLYVKANDPPEGIPTESVEKVAVVAQLYTKATVVAEAKTQKEGAELVKELFEMAQKEHGDQFDLEQAMEQAGTLSSPYAQMWSIAEAQGFDTAGVAEAIEGILVEWDTEEFGEFVSAGSTEEVEETVDIALNLFLQLANEVSNSVYDELQADRESL